VHHHKVLLFNYDIYCKTTLVPKDVLKNSWQLYRPTCTTALKELSSIKEKMMCL
jgi:hypothetical protein